MAAVTVLAVIAVVAVLIEAAVSGNSTLSEDINSNTTKGLHNTAANKTAQAGSPTTIAAAASRPGEDFKKTATPGYNLNNARSRTPHDGPKSKRRLARIIGGVDAFISEFPHQVAWLMYGNFICGGSLISPEWILSAAHCFLYGNDTQGSSFRVGANHTVQGGSTHSAVSFHQHPGWTAPGMDWDIGLVRIEPPAQLGDSVQPIRLVEPRAQLQDNDTLTVIGWGATAEHGETFQYGGSYYLQKLSVHLVNHSDCAEQYNGVGQLTERMLCALAPHKDTCHGDSGGPLMLGAVEDGSLRLLGVVSWGAGCADIRYPGVYSDLRQPGYRQYIETVTGIKL